MNGTRCTLNAVMEKFRAFEQIGIRFVKIKSGYYLARDRLFFLCRCNGEGVLMAFPRDASTSRTGSTSCECSWKTR